MAVGVDIDVEVLRCEIKKNLRQGVPGTPTRTSSDSPCGHRLETGGRSGAHASRATAR
jgi:hypothetical protein